MKSSFSRCLIPGAVLLLVPVTAGSAPIVDTFGPGDTYQTLGFVSAANAVSAPTDLDWAFQFTVSAPATVESYEVALHLITGSNEVDLLLMEDAGNLPGPVIDSVRVVNQMIGGTGVIIWVNSANRPMLTTANEYWLGVSAASSSSTETRVRWRSTVVTGPSAHYAERQNNGGWSLGAGSPTLTTAFRINDMPVNAQTATWSRIKALYGTE